MADEIKFTKGLKVDLPNLLLAEPGFVVDEKRLYIGGPTGNIPLPNKEDLDGINTSLSDKANKYDGAVSDNFSSDFNNVTNQGRYSFNSSCINGYKPTSYGMLDVIRRQSDASSIWLWQIAYYTTGEIACRYNINSTGWTSWKQLATNDKPTEIAVTPQNGFTTSGGSKASYAKTQDGVIILNIFLNNSASAALNTTMFTLPSGYMPSSFVRARGLVNDIYPAEVTISTDGTVKVYAINTLSTYLNVAFDCSFVAMN